MLHHFAHRHTRWLGVLGPAILIAGALAASFGYQDYSFLNHAISDLGDPGQSPWAMCFNLGMMLGSALTALFTYGVGRRLSTPRSRRITRVGVAGSIGMGLVGLFPSTPALHTPHLAVAGFAFVCTVILGAGFTLDMLLSEQDVLPRWLIAPGALAAACSLSFLIALVAKDAHLVPREVFHFGQAGPRPQVDLVAALEWSVLFSILLWSFLTAATFREPAPASAAAD